MKENSNFVLRWEIDNVSAKLATGKMESGVFNEGGFKWTAVAAKRISPPNDLTDFTLRCDMDHDGPWKVEVEVEVEQQYKRIRGSRMCWKKGHFIFSDTTGSWMQTSAAWWQNLDSIIYASNDKITFDFNVRIISSERGEPISATFDAPNRRSDVILKIGENKLHVSKEILAIHSPFFETLFFGDFAENGKEEVEIKDVDYQGFVDLLNLIYVRSMQITDFTLPRILKLADQFQMEVILDQSKKYLIQSKGIDVVKKLMIADQYRLVSLRDYCLQNFTSVNEVKQKLMSSSEFVNFSSDMKTAICERISELPLQMTDNPKFVLRWEIDNAAATLATGKAESGVFNEGGLQWKIGVQPFAYEPLDVDIVLTCNHQRRGKWRCEADVKLVEPLEWDKTRLTFHEGCQTSIYEDEFFTLAQLTTINEEYNINGKVVIEFQVHIINTERTPILDLTKFTSPNEIGNVTLVIRDKKVQVSKEYLAIHSPVFSAMFFGNFVEKGKEEVELKDVVHEDFIDLLQVIFLDGVEITDHSVPHILKLADQFQMERVLNLSEKHLMQSKGLDTMRKLLLADQYRLVALKDHCHNSFTNATDLIVKLKSSPDFADFSAVLKVEFLERVMKLT